MSTNPSLKPTDKVALTGTFRSIGAAIAKRPTAEAVTTGLNLTIEDGFAA